MQFYCRLTFEDSDSERGELLDKSRDVPEPDGLESEDSEEEEEEPASVPQDRRIIKVLDDRPVFKPSGKPILCIPASIMNVPSWQFISYLGFSVN